MNVGDTREELERKLKEPFDPKVIHWRVGATNRKQVVKKTGDQNAKPTKGIPLAYLDARDVMKRLDEIFGVFGWQNKSTMYGKVAICDLGINVDGEWVWKSDGAGETDVEGEKGSLSDALKRAAARWGVGRYLYYLPNTWVDLDERGNIKGTPSLPKWALPGSHTRVDKKIRDKVYEQSVSCLQNGDDIGLREVWIEFDADEIASLWGEFSPVQRDQIKTRIGL